MMVLPKRVIGSLWRELLDHVIGLRERHLCQLLREYADYYNKWRTHLGLDKHTPLTKAGASPGSITAVPKLGGLHHAYMRI